MKVWVLALVVAGGAWASEPASMPRRPAIRSTSATVASDAPSAILAMSTTRCTAIVRVVRVRSGCELCAMMRVNAR